MEHIKTLYQDAFNKNGDSPASVLWPKGRQSERFYALSKNINSIEPFSVLDFGCGLAHLKEYLNTNYSNAQYTGVDIVDDFLNHNRKKFPNSDFIKPEEFYKSEKCYDYIFSSGAFNILYVTSKEEHKKIVFDILKKLFNKTTKYMSVNFMTDQVDFQQEGAYHQNVSELFEFCSINLTKRLQIDQSYMPFEYTITLWKDQTILKPENTYRP
ncbi:MAG TPA: class I SAM-dependent methyltransferase [Bacteroidia bacterium]|nr:class I SAM-dependent methyltransferase [Bacteroidia bacterium]